MDSNPTIKWCPYPECGMAVRSPRVLINNNSEILVQDVDQQNTSFTSVSSCSSSNNKDYSKSVDCGSGHYFCWYLLVFYDMSYLKIIDDEPPFRNIKKKNQK